jgi:cytochrome c-type biogenesis protein CcmH/NrfG
MEAGSYDEAEVAYRQAIAVAPTNPEVRMKAGEFFEKIGKRDDALSEYEEAYRIDPNNSEVQIRITALGGGIPQSPEENKGQ